MFKEIFLKWQANEFTSIMHILKIAGTWNEYFNILKQPVRMHHKMQVGITIKNFASPDWPLQFLLTHFKYFNRSYLAESQVDALKIDKA